MLERVTRLLIANRGEIACRIMRTARRLAIDTIAVYSQADRDALHVDQADEAWPIGSAPATDSYLCGERIIDVARRSGADAIHPGYGFLSENPEFAEQCADAGLNFVGPPAAAMRLMGSKAKAKDIAESVGVPTVPGYRAAGDFARVEEAAREIGYPVLIKASAGGGGRGMRVVRHAGDLATAMEAARREALASFGDGQLIYEKYLERPRHIEVQIFADAYGEVVTFMERDCSLQRRHQKIIEETPAPGLSPDLRAKLRDAAVALALAVGYRGAGTMEFLVQGDAFYFLEMNTRLQVEHPVTEMIAGVDLVEWQLRIACGEPSPLSQHQLAMRGAAIEARLCAESPQLGFLPSIGRIERLRLPAESVTVRVDSGVREDDVITPYYDSLIAKIAVWGADRNAALRALSRQLEQVEVTGLDTNLDLLKSLCRHPAVISGGVDTGFVERELPELIDAPLSRSNEIIVVAAVCAFWIQETRDNAAQLAKERGQDESPWSVFDGFRLNGAPSISLSLSYQGKSIEARFSLRGESAFVLELGGDSAQIGWRNCDGRLKLFVNEIARSVGVTRHEKAYAVAFAGKRWLIEPVVKAKAQSGAGPSERRLTTPLPARVTKLCVAAGERVLEGDDLVILEAMKMEIPLRAPQAGVVKEILCRVGDMAPQGATLIELEEASA